LQHGALLRSERAAQQRQQQGSGGLTAPVLLQAARVNRSEDGRFASVHLEHAGKSYRYQLTARSVYSEDAKVSRHTEQGTVRAATPKPRTFVSREHGKWASAALHDDGTCSGLFEDGHGHVMQVRPASEAADQLALLQETHRHQGRQHIVQHLHAPSVLGGFGGPRLAGHEKGPFKRAGEAPDWHPFERTEDGSPNWHVKEGALPPTRGKGFGSGAL